MKYIRNTGRYALSFTVKKGAYEDKINFDRRRIYLDTGNIATSGITEVDDDTLKLLEGIPQFKTLLANGTFEMVKDSELVPTTEAKDKEIAELKEKLAKAEKKTDKKELEAKDKEIADLKAQLEALATKAKTEETKEAEGF